MEEQPLIAAEGLYNLNGKKTGNWGAFVFMKPN